MPSKKPHSKHPKIFSRELLLKEDQQEYGQITKVLGNCKVEIMCFDGKTRLGSIRGKLRKIPKGMRMKMGDIVLISLREYQDGIADVIHSYTHDEMKILKAKGEIP